MVRYTTTVYDTPVRSWASCADTDRERSANAADGVQSSFKLVSMIASAR